MHGVSDGACAPWWCMEYAWGPGVSCGADRRRLESPMVAVGAHGGRVSPLTLTTNSKTGVTILRHLVLRMFGRNVYSIARRSLKV